MEHKRRKWYRWLLIGFFLFMLFGTAASRVYDSVTVPKVLTTYSKRKSVETVITGTGTVKEGETVFCSVAPGLKVESVTAAAGSEVKAGDELFRYQMESLNGKKAELEEKLERAKLDLERLDISSETYAQVTQTELAQRELELARQELAEGQQEYDEKWAEHFVNLKNMEADFEKKKMMTDDELMLSQEQQMAGVSLELRTARASRDTQLREAGQKVEDLKAQIEAAKTSDPSEGDAGADAAGLEQQLAAAQRELEELETQWRLQIDGIRSRYDVLDMQYGRIKSGATSTQEALKEAYDATVKQENAAWEAEEEKLEALKKNEENARWNLDIASRRDEYTRLTADQQARLSQIDRKLKEMDIAACEAELGSLEAMIRAEGRVLSERDGTVILQEVAAGRTTTGEERLSIAAGSRIFEAEFDKEGQELSVGDLLTVSIPGSTRTVEARVDSMNLLGEETGTFRADLADLNLAIGTITSYQCRRTSDTYQQVIPLSALRRDSEGYYCLAVRTRSAVMGQEFKAERVGLTVLEMGNTEAAVEGAVFDTDPLITASNQVIVSGDRVRPVEDLQG